MFKKIYREIKKYNKIVIARHVGVDPDAMASQIALRDSIKLTFPEKEVLAVGTGSQKFKFIGNLDKFDNGKDALLIVVDTPDKKRVDIPSMDEFAMKIKIDHHPFIEKFCDLEYIEDEASSAAEILMNMISETKLECNDNIARTLFIGLVSDSNRFLFNSCTYKTFDIVSKYLKNYNFNMNETYQQMYLRPLKEVRFEGHIASNLKLTENGVAYIKITDDDINKYEVDSASAGNMVNKFNFIDEVYVWMTITEDVKNEFIRISIRSRGPIINKIAEKYNGGGHKFASGVKVPTFDEAMKVVKDLDNVVCEYKKEKKVDNNGD